MWFCCKCLQSRVSFWSLCWFVCLLYIYVWVFVEYCNYLSESLVTSQDIVRGKDAQILFFNPELLLASSGYDMIFSNIFSNIFRYLRRTFMAYLMTSTTKLPRFVSWHPKLGQWDVHPMFIQLIPGQNFTKLHTNIYEICLSCGYSLIYSGYSGYTKTDIYDLWRLLDIHSFREWGGIDWST